MVRFKYLFTLLIGTLSKSAKIKGITLIEKENSVETNFVRDSKYWKMKIVKSNHKIAFITYNCYNDNIDPYEIRAVNRIFNSFKLKQIK